MERDALSAIFKNEIRTLLGSRKFLAGLLLQVAIALLLVPFTSSIMTRIVVNQTSIVSPTMERLIGVAVIDRADLGLAERISRDSRIRTLEVRDPEEGMRLLRRGEVSAVILASGDRENPKIDLMVPWRDSRGRYILDTIEGNLEDLSSEISERKLSEIGFQPYGIVITSVYAERASEEGSIDRERGEASPLRGLIESIVVPATILFPIFFVAGLLSSSIVGEKERKTIENLLASPLTSLDLILGKLLAYLLVLEAVLVLPLVALRLAGYTRAPILLSLLVLAPIGLLVLSSSTLIASICRNYKEVGVLASLTNVALFFVIFAPVVVVFTTGFPSRASPLIDFARLSLGEDPRLMSLLDSSMRYLLASLVMLILSIKLMEREDVALGSTPPLRVIFYDFLEYSLKDSGTLALLLASSVIGALSIIPVTILEYSSGVVLYYALSERAMMPLLMIWALVEEFLKPSFLYFLRERRSNVLEDYLLTLLLGIMAGLGFSIVESGFLLALSRSIPGMSLKMLIARRAPTIAIHSICSAILAIGIARDRIPAYLALSASIHFAYNALVVSAI